MNNKLKNLTYVIILFFIFLFIFFTIISFYKKNRIQSILNNHTNKIDIFYGILQHNQKTIANVVYKETIQNQDFLNIFYEANIAKSINDEKTVDKLRKKAENLFYSKYELYKEKGILQYHFVFPDNIVFLRMHKPNKYGDDLTNIRTDFNYTNKNLKVVRGFSQGKTSHAFRNVYPIIDNNKRHLGSIEISFSTELLQEYFTDVNKIHTHFLVKKDIFKSHAWKRDDLILKYYPSAEHDNYMITMTHNHTLKKCINDNSIKLNEKRKEIHDSMNKGERFSIYTTHDGNSRVTSFYPILHNITKDTVAWIVSYVQEDLIDETIQISFIMYILIFIILCILFIFVYFLIYQKDILNSKVKEKTSSLEKANKELEESENKLQVINENLEHKIQEEVEKSRQKDKVLFEQSKMLAMGEMISNIAHQWRQPLSIISTSATGAKVQNELGLLNNGNINSYLDTINNTAQHLSSTIEDFRNFFDPNKNKISKFNILNTIDKILNLVSAQFTAKKIKIIKNVELIEINSLENEFVQALVNILNNSKDALINIDSQKFIFIDAYKKGDKLVIKIYDTGNGIEDNIIDRIFEPYFTTKHKSQETGIGLYMTREIITKLLKGSIQVSNKEFIYKDKEYKGAEFIIEINI